MAPLHHFAIDVIAAAATPAAWMVRLKLEHWIPSNQRGQLHPRGVSCTRCWLPMPGSVCWRRLPGCCLRTQEHTCCSCGLPVQGNGANSVGVDCWVSTARVTSCLGALNTCCCSLTVNTLRALCCTAECSDRDCMNGTHDTIDALLRALGDQSAPTECPINRS